MKNGFEGKNVAVYAMHVFNGRRENMCRQGSFIFLFFFIWNIYKNGEKMLQDYIEKWWNPNNQLV